MGEIKPWLEPDEVTVGGQNTHRVTEDKLVEVASAKDWPVHLIKDAYTGMMIWAMSPAARKMVESKVRRIELAEKKRKRQKRQRQARKKARGR